MKAALTKKTGEDVVKSEIRWFRRQVKIHAIS